MTSKLITGLQFPLGIDAIETIRRSGLAERTIGAYTAEIAHFLDAGHTLTDPDALREWGATLSPGRARTFRSAIACWAKRTAAALDNQVVPMSWIETQAAKDRLGTLAGNVQTETPKGEKAHTWLSRAQVDDLRAALDGDDILTCRDRVIIGLMLAAGLRRDEVTNVKWSDLIRQPTEDGDMATVLNVHGKGDKWRGVQIAHTLEKHLDAWAAWVGRDGLIVRRLGRQNEIHDSGISRVSVHKITAKYGKAAGIPETACHDLRRTFAQTAYGATKDIFLVSRLLGHASVTTTQKYLELDQGDASAAVNATAWR